jgi:predicted MPP superfamily phosphohydrolase
MLSPIQALFGQPSGELSASANDPEWIKIVNPVAIHQVSSEKELLVSGQSSDNVEKNCSVSVIVNDIRPYQMAIAKGKAGLGDFSQWEFVIHENYTHIIEGQNKITGKLQCESAPTRWNSVVVNGVPNYKPSETISPVESTQQLQQHQSNASETISPVESTQHSQLLVSISPQKNPVARGDTQNATVTVTDSNHRPIPNAQIDGKLIYPGENFVKPFKGSTDIEGKFVYSWTVGKKGDAGPLVITVEASHQGYQATSANNSFEVVKTDESPKIDNKSYPSGIRNTVTLAAAGDFYCDAKTKKTAKAMQERNPDLVLALGDLSEVKNPACFFKLFSKADKAGKIKVVLGSDDTDNIDDHSSRYSQYMRHFDMKEPFYSFDYQNIHFLAMATGDDRLIPFGSNSTQYTFVSNDLARSSSNKNIDWIVVFGYRPFYSSPSTHPGSQNIRNSYPSLFEKYGVDLVISAHNHNYQRTYPVLFNNERPGKPIIKDGTNSSDYQNPGVPVYVIAGTAGAPPHELVAQSQYIAKQFIDTGFLFVNITKTNTEKQLQGAFQSSNNGTDIDQFSITKFN